MSHTLTGHFPIGFRPRGAEWSKDLVGVIRFANAEGFAGLDPTNSDPRELQQIRDGGLRIGSADLKQPWSDLASPLVEKRIIAADANAAWIAQAVALGATNFFAVIIPAEHDRARSENFAFAVDGFGRLARAIEPLGAKIVLEGWPGRAPHYSSLACTPAEIRALFKAIDSRAIGINFDPSHLTRMGIDAVRFVDEFASRIFHVHAKDTLFLPEEQYELGNLQPATFTQPHLFGGQHWRYTIPGHGVLPWTKLFSKLAASGYRGIVSVELEDEQFHGTEAAEKAGLLAARDFLVCA